MKSDKVEVLFFPDKHLIRLLLVQDQTVKPGEQNRMYNTYLLHCKSVWEKENTLVVYNVTTTLESNLMFNKAEDVYICPITQQFYS